MTRRLWIRIGLVAVVALVAVFVLYPPRKTINLGLDLQGGIHLVLGVDIDKALQVQTERAGDTVRAALEKKGVAVKSIERRGTTELAVQLASPQARMLSDSTRNSMLPFPLVKQSMRHSQEFYALQGMYV